MVSNSFRATSVEALRRIEATGVRDHEVSRRDSTEMPINEKPRLVRFEVNAVTTCKMDRDTQAQ